MYLYLSLSALHVSDSLVHHQEQRLELYIVIGIVVSRSDLPQGTYRGCRSLMGTGFAHWIRWSGGGRWSQSWRVIPLNKSVY